MRAGEALLRAVVELTPIGTLLVDGRGTVVLVNRAIEELFGYTRDELLGQPVEVLIPAQLRERHAGFRAEFHRDPAPRLMGPGRELVGLRKDGGEIPVDIGLTPIETGDGRFVLATVLDASARTWAGRRLQEMSDRYHRTLDNMMEGCQIISVDGRYLYLNDAAARHGRQPKEQLLGRKMTEAYPGVEDTEMFAAMRRCATEGIPVNMVNEFRYPDGSTGWFELRMQPVPEGVFILSIDVTDRKRAEEALRHSEARYHDLFDGAPVALYRSTPDGTLLDVNPAFVRLLGFPDRASALRVKAHDLYLNPDDRRRWQRLLEQHHAVIGFETRTRGADGRMLWVEENSHATRDADGKVLYYQGALLDITPRKQAEEAAREGQERFRLLAELAQDVIYRYRLVEPRGFEYVSPSVTRVVGYTPEEHYADPDLGMKLIHSDDRPLLEAMMQQPVSGAPTVTLRWRHRDGRTIWTEHRVAEVRDETGRLVAIQGIARDVTERRSLEQQYLQAQKMEAVGRLAGGIAHDFNNLLTAITGYAELLRDEIPLGDPRRQDIDEIAKAAVRAAGLTRQLLAFSRQQVLQPRVLDLNDVVTGMDKMLRRIIGEDVDLVTVLAPDLGRVRADVGQIEQVIVNLAVNSRDAMPGGGKLTIETANVDLTAEVEATRRSLAPGAYVLLAVSDTGSGIPEEVKAHIFEPFFTTKEPGQGTGLGLATVYGIVRQSGGEVLVYSEPGHGTTFQVYIPRVEDTAERLVAADRPAGAPRGSETILLVEDETGVRNLARQVLRRRGYHVLEAANPEEARRLCQEYAGPIHLLLTDLVMPGTSGPEAARELRQARPEMKVLFMSGYPDRAVAHRNAVDPSVPFLQKPFAPDTLAVKVREALERAS